MLAFVYQCCIVDTSGKQQALINNKGFKMYSFITKTKNGFNLMIRTSFDYSEGTTITTRLFDTKKQARDYAKSVNAKAWNY